MDSLPPNDPNRFGGSRGSEGAAPAKEQPFDGRSHRRDSRGRRGGGGSGSDQGRDGQPMDAMGDLRDTPVIVAMFLLGVATWVMRERCVC